MLTSVIVLDSPVRERRRRVREAAQLDRETRTTWRLRCSTGTLRYGGILGSFGEHEQFGLLVHPRRHVLLAHGGDAERRYRSAIDGRLGPLLAAYLLHPLSGRGTWQGVDPFPGGDPSQAAGRRFCSITCSHNRPMTVPRMWLTSLPGIVHQLGRSSGNLEAMGVVHFPTFDGITFSTWECEADMERFAGSAEHLREIRRSVGEDWFVETYFGRFAIVESYGGVGRVSGLPAGASPRNAWQ